MTELSTEVEWHFRADEAGGEENIVEGRVVPFNQVATVIEHGERYREGFRAGSLTFMHQFAKQRGNAAWVHLNLDHDESLPARIGFARSFEQRDDGGWATFKLYPSADLPKVRSMLTESHTGLSVLFDDLAPPVDVDGVRWRTQVKILHVAATPIPVYAGAGITSVRAAGAPDPSELLTPALDEWTAYLDGLKRPQ